MKAAITGVGALSPLGLDLETFWSSIVQEKDCIHAGLGAFSQDQKQAIQSLVPPLASGKGARKIAQLSFLAAKEAMSKAAWAPLSSEDGIILGTTTGQIIHWEELLSEGYRNNNFQEFRANGGITTPGSSLSELCDLLNFRGKSILLCSACSASTQALGLAAAWVRSGRVKRCLVGGAEVLTKLSVEGFKSLGLLSLERAKPFDEKRAGINLSEGAAFFCVELAPGNSQNIQAYLSGFSTNSDAYHLTAPHPEGAGTLRVFEEALKMANLSPSQIDWIHAHGTASPSNDSAEGAALQKIFPRSPVTSTKAYHGHALGASGALEVALCVEALRQQMRIKSLGCEELDSKLDIQIQKEHEKAPLRHILKNSLGFGGVNASLILSHPQSEELTL